MFFWWSNADAMKFLCGLDMRVAVVPFEKSSDMYQLQLWHASLGRPPSFFHTPTEKCLKHRAMMRKEGSIPKWPGSSWKLEIGGNVATLLTSTLYITCPLTIQYFSSTTQVGDTKTNWIWHITFCFNKKNPDDFLILRERFFVLTGPVVQDPSASTWMRKTQHSTTTCAARGAGSTVLPVSDESNEVERIFVSKQPFLLGNKKGTWIFLEGFNPQFCLGGSNNFQVEKNLCWKSVTYFFLFCQKVSGWDFF